MHFAILHLGCLVKSLSFYLDYQLLPATSSVELYLSYVFQQLLIKILDENIFSYIKNVISLLYNVEATIGKGDDDDT